MNAITAKQQTAIGRPLQILVPLIQEDIEAGRKAGLPFYQTAGEKLLEAKPQVKHGEWAGWVKRNFDVSPRTAGDWMRLAAATNGKSAAGHRFETLSGFTHPGRDTHQPAWHEPVRDVVNRVNVAKLSQERQERETEAKLQRELGFQLIDIGYKALAAKLHPDKGGSTDAMTRLNQVKSVLRQAIGG